MNFSPFPGAFQGGGGGGPQERLLLLLLVALRFPVPIEIDTVLCYNVRLLSGFCCSQCSQ